MAASNNIAAAAHQVRAGTIPPAHQARLYTGHQHPYAHSVELGASARRIHQLQQQCPAYVSLNHQTTTTPASLMAQNLSQSRMVGTEANIYLY